MPDLELKVARIQVVDLPPGLRSLRITTALARGQ